MKRGAAPKFRELGGSPVKQIKQKTTKATKTTKTTKPDLLNTDWTSPGFGQPSGDHSYHYPPKIYDIPKKVQYIQHTDRIYDPTRRTDIRYSSYNPNAQWYTGAQPGYRGFQQQGYHHIANKGQNYHSTIISLVAPGPKGGSVLSNVVKNPLSTTLKIVGGGTAAYVIGNEVKDVIKDKTSENQEKNTLEAVNVVTERPTMNSQVRETMKKKAGEGFSISEAEHKMIDARVALNKTLVEGWEPEYSYEGGVRKVTNHSMSRSKLNKKLTNVSGDYFDADFTKTKETFNDLYFKSGGDTTDIK